MERDLQIHCEDVNQLRAELVYVVEFFRRLGYERCNILFGFAWRIEPEKPALLWKSVQILLLDLDTEIRKAEDAGLGNFGHDDVRVSFEGLALKVQFCHHSGIHLSYTEPDDITEHFFVRWQSGGLNPSENEKTEDRLKWRRIRGAGA